MLQGYDHLRTWQENDFRLEVFTAWQVDNYGKIVNYHYRKATVWSLTRSLMECVFVATFKASLRIAQACILQAALTSA